MKVKIKLRWTIAACLLSSLYCMNLHAANFYWVGGAGNWSDINHWATTSGGNTHPTGVPVLDSDVYFDANSGATNFTVTIASPATCRDLSFSADTKCTNMTMNVNENNQILTIAGSLYINNTLTFGRTGTATNPTGMFFQSNAAGNIVHLNGNPLNRLNVTFSGSGNWTIDGDFVTASTSIGTYAADQGNLTFTNGATVTLQAGKAMTVNSELNIDATARFVFAGCNVTCHRFVNANDISSADSDGSMLTVNTIPATGYAGHIYRGVISSNAGSYFCRAIIKNTTNLLPETITQGHLLFLN